MQRRSRNNRPEGGAGGDPRNALIFWKSEARRLRQDLRRAETRSETALIILRPVVQLFAADKGRALKDVGLPDFRATFQLLAGFSEQEFANWHARATAALQNRED